MRPAGRPGLDILETLEVACRRSEDKEQGRGYQDTHRLRVVFISFRWTGLDYFISLGQGQQPGPVGGAATPCFRTARPLVYT